MVVREVGKQELLAMRAKRTEAASERLEAQMAVNMARDVLFFDVCQHAAWPKAVPTPVLPFHMQHHHLIMNLPRVNTVNPAFKDLQQNQDGQRVVMENTNSLKLV